MTSAVLVSNLTRTWPTELKVTTMLWVGVQRHFLQWSQSTSLTTEPNFSTTNEDHAPITGTCA